MKVLKFGGTSVGSAERIKHVASMLRQCDGDIVVLSAMSGTTNALVEIASHIADGDKNAAQTLTDALRSKYKDVVTSLFEAEEQREAVQRRLWQSFDLIEAHTATPYVEAYGKEITAQGELMSTALMHEYLKSQGVDVVMLPALDYMRIDETGEPVAGAIQELLLQLLATHSGAQLYLTQGFICRDHNGLISTLTRGGSDYTATLVGAAVGADEIQIWTDIDGIHNNDPRYVEGTRPIPQLHFSEAALLAYYGAKILHPDCVRPAQQRHIPIRLLDTMNPTAAGTLISDNDSGLGIKAVAAKEILRDHEPEAGHVQENATLIGIVGKPYDTDHALAAIEDALAGIRQYRPIQADAQKGISVVINSDDKIRALRALSAQLFDNKDKI